MTDLRIRTIVSQPFEENSYLVGLATSSEVFVIDPGFQPELIIDAIHEESLKLTAIVCTHGHVDHIAGNDALKRAFPDAPILIGERDAVMLIDADANLSAPFGVPVVSPPADRVLREGDVVELAGLTLEVFDIPGHSPGHVVFVRRGSPTIVLGGDVLFRGGVGRTDFPGGSFAQLKNGIEAKLWPLPDDAVVYPGHGPVTTIGHEKRTNPFL